MDKTEDVFNDVAGLATRKVWICGELSDEWDGIKTPWVFQGLFSTKAMAVVACKTEKYFIFSAMANAEIAIEPMEAEDLSFPVIEVLLS